MDTPAATPSRAWLVVIAAALLFFYEFIQLNLPDSIGLYLLKDFHLDASTLSQLSSLYFISNVIFLLPAGIILDRVSTRLVILVALTICIIGTFMLSFAPDPSWVAYSRFLAGIGSAFCFLSAMRLASRWFPPHRLALVSGVVVTMAMLGGLVAQTPMTLLTQTVGWRHAVLFDAFLGIIFFFIILFVVKDYPAGGENEHKHQKIRLQQMGFMTTMRMAYLNPKNWACGIYTSFMNLPIFILGAIWGIPYLVQIQHVTSTQASNVVAALFLGSIIGCPVIGWFSDTIKRRKLPMIIGAILALACLLIIIEVPNLGLTALLILFFALGFISSSQIISYPTVTESNPTSITAMAVSVISLCAISGGAIFQPLFGKLMDLHWDHTIINGNPIYSKGDYHLALLVLPITFIIALVLSIAIRETYAKRNS